MATGYSLPDLAAREGYPGICDAAVRATHGHHPIAIASLRPYFFLYSLIRRNTRITFSATSSLEDYYNNTLGRAP